MIVALILKTGYGEGLERNDWRRLTIEEHGEGTPKL